MSTLTKPQIYLLAIRPRTLFISISPILIGTMLALKTQASFPLFLCIVLFSLFIQIGTNLANDYFDFIQGADTQERKGFVRVTQKGLLDTTQIKTAFILAFISAFIFSLYPIYLGGPIFFVLSIGCILCGIFYTATKYSIGYLGLGEVFVFVFFGLLAVNGTYFLQTGSITSTSILASLTPGLIPTCVIIVNNLRDIEEDRKASKKTLAVRFGKTFIKSLYICCLSISFVAPILLVILCNFSYPILLPLLITPLAIAVAKQVMQEQKLNLALEKTAKLLVIYTLLFCIGTLF